MTLVSSQIGRDEASSAEALAVTKTVASPRDRLPGTARSLPIERQAERDIIPLEPPFEPVSAMGEHCWRSPLPPDLLVQSDDLDHRLRSRWRLLEDGRPIGYPHAFRMDIGRTGHGCYSHWQDALFFSTSDNSDPNQNGRRYALRQRSEIAWLRPGPTTSPVPFPGAKPVRHFKPLMDFYARAREIAETLKDDPRCLEIFIRAIEALRPDKIHQLQRRFAAELHDFDPVSRFMYLDIPYWIRDKIGHVTRLQLDRRPPMTILDIGVGCGHFPVICEALGHTVLGIDICNPVYNDVADALEIRYRIRGVAHHEAIGDLGSKFDLVTALAVVFDHTDSRQHVYWSLEDWAFLFQDLFDNQLRFPGEIYFELNRQSNGLYNTELQNWIAQKGAAVDIENGVIALGAPNHRRDFWPAA